MYKEIIDKAFRRARLFFSEDPRERYITRFDIIRNIVISELNKILNDLPDVKNLNDFYKELYDISFGINNIKLIRRRIGKIIINVNRLFNEYKEKIKKENIKNYGKIRREYYGRISSFLKRNKKIFDLYLEFKKIKKRIPVIRDYPTVIISGLPNVGKSTLLKNLTGSEPEIQPYPFTTKDLMLGYIKENNKIIQVIDTPGILDRPFDRLNNIEKKAYLALKYLSKYIIYVIDLTEYCGYSIHEQLDLLKRIEEKFKDSKIIVYFSKYDLLNEKLKEEMREIAEKLNKLYFYDYGELKKYIIENL